MFAMSLKAGRSLTIYHLLKTSRKDYEVLARNGLGSIENIRDKGLRYFDKGSREQEKWLKECNELLILFRNFTRRHSLGMAKDILNELIHFSDKLHHAEMRMHELLYSRALKDKNKQNEFIRNLFFELSFAYKLSIYAIITINAEKCIWSH